MGIKDQDPSSGLNHPSNADAVYADAMMKRGGSATDHIRFALERIADVQEKLLEIAEEARSERKAIADKMKETFKPGFQGFPQRVEEK